MAKRKTKTRNDKMQTKNAPEYLKDKLNYVGKVQPYHLRNAKSF